MGREFELKYRADACKIQEIQRKYGHFTTITMETAYYDNPDRDFAARRWTLRRRMENGASVCTLKTPLPDGSRGEWEVEAGTIESGVSKLCKLDVPAELDVLTKDGLTETCAAKFTRLAKVISLGDTLVELALDEGCLLGSGQVLPFAEVEVELKEGSEVTALTFARELAADFSLIPEQKSKQQRALELVR